MRKKQHDYSADELMVFIRDAKANILPEDGAWVSIKGNPYTVRGLRIPQSIRDEGVRHMDIYWAYDEGTPWHLPMEFAAVHDSGKDIVDDILWANGGSHNGLWEGQLTWMTLHTPSSKLIRMWAGEVAVMSQELIDKLLDNNYLQMISIANTQLNPVWDEVTRDMIGSLMLDGMSLQRAQAELLGAGEMVRGEMIWKLPTHFYRPIGEYYNTFCEEPEHKMFMQERKKVNVEETIV